MVVGWCQPQLKHITAVYSFRKRWYTAERPASAPYAPMRSVRSQPAPLATTQHMHTVVAGAPSNQLENETMSGGLMSQRTLTPTHQSATGALLTRLIEALARLARTGSHQHARALTFTSSFQGTVNSGRMYVLTGAPRCGALLWRLQPNYVNTRC